MELTNPVDLLTWMSMDHHQILLDLRVTVGSHRDGPVLVGVVGSWSDSDTHVLGEYPADRFDSPATLVLVNESGDYLRRRPASAFPKYAVAARRISFVLRSSRTSASRARIRAAESSLLTGSCASSRNVRIL